MARFVGHLALFLLPLLLGAAFLEAELWRTGETWPGERVLAAQKKAPGLLYMRAYFGQWYEDYKWRGLVDSRAEILALGSSRVMKLRQEMFGPRLRFYNAGGLVRSVGDLQEVVRMLPADYAPRVVLLGIDAWWLNASRDSRAPLQRRLRDDPARSEQAHLGFYGVLLRSPRFRGLILRGLYRPQAPDALGLRARATGLGFRLDGSLKGDRPAPVGDASRRFVDTARPPYAVAARNGQNHFRITEGVSPALLAGLRDAVEALRRRGTLVVAFAPPIAGEVAAVLEEIPAQRAFWHDYRRRVAALFADLDLPYVDASTPGQLGLDDRSMLDGIHAEETLHLHLLRRMLQDPRMSGRLPGARAAVAHALAAPETDVWHPEFPRP
jgi:hypothetical protein